MPGSPTMEKTMPESPTMEKTMPESPTMEKTMPERPTPERLTFLEFTWRLPGICRRVRRDTAWHLGYLWETKSGWALPERPESPLVLHCMKGVSFVHLHDGSLVYIYIYIYIYY
jgi:hypothetical protein